MGLDFLSRGFRCLLGLSPWGSAAGEAEIQRTWSKGGRFQFSGEFAARSTTPGEALGASAPVQLLNCPINRNSDYRL